MENTSELEQRILDAMGEPILPALDENTIKIRRNLLFVSALSCFLTFFHIQIGSANIGGLAVSNINTEVTLNALSFLILYHLGHFHANVYDYAKKWRIRCTGARVYFQTQSTYGNIDIEGGRNPEQTSLYAWWAQRGLRVKEMERRIMELEEYGTKIDSIIEQLSYPESLKNTLEHQNVLRSLSEHKKLLDHLPQNIKDAVEVIKSPRMEISLKRFDKWFWNYQLYQVANLLLIEYFFPVFLALVALQKSYPHIFGGALSIIGNFIKTLSRV